MFWLGEALALIAGLIAVSAIRRVIRSRSQAIRDLHLDIAIVVLLVIGLLISTIIHLGEVSKSTQLAKGVEALRDFSGVARLGPTGVTGTAGAGLKETTPISAALEEAWVERDGNLYPYCDDASLAKFRRVTKIAPRFPFSHYALAVCLRGQGDPTWQNHAQIALNLFEKTTILVSHHASHDQARDELLGYLSGGG
jgi:hypothetical protein